MTPSLSSCAGGMFFSEVGWFHSAAGEGVLMINASDDSIARGGSILLLILMTRAWNRCLTSAR